MEINEDKLYDELLEVRRKLIRNQSTNNIRKYYPVFEQLNYTLAQITGFAVDPKDMLYRNVDELNDDIRLQNKKQILEYFNRAITEGDPLYFLFMSFNDILKESNYIPLINDNIPFYNETQAREMILTYFKQFGDKIYNIAKSYLDGRVSINIDLDPGTGGSFMNNYANELGYILIKYGEFNAASISAIVHEIGHAIDNSLFVYPQQKELSLSNQFLIEVPSTFFEINFLQYLIENNIDVDAAEKLLGEMSTYDDALADFIKEADSKYNLLQGYMKIDKLEKCYNIFRTIKTDTRYLGFIELNSIFSNLEKAIKENDIDYVKNNIKTSLKVFKKYIEISKEYLGK